MCNITLKPTTWKGSLFLATFVTRRSGLEMHYRCTKGFSTKEIMLINRFIHILLICFSKDKEGAWATQVSSSPKHGKLRREKKIHCSVCQWNVYKYIYFLSLLVLFEHREGNNFKLHFWVQLRKQPQTYRSPKTFSVELSPKLVNPPDFHQLWWHFCRKFRWSTSIFTNFGDVFFTILSDFFGE